MTREFGFGVVVFGIVVSSFAACGGEGNDPIGDNLDGSTRTTPPGSRPSSGGFNDDGTNGNVPSSGTPGTTCDTDRDCPTGEICIESDCVSSTGSSGTNSSGGSSGGSSGSSGSSGNPNGAALGEPCAVDGDCASNLCTTTKQTGVLACSASCVKGQDNYPDGLCPSNLPLCGDEVDAQGNERPTPICRNEI